MPRKSKYDQMVDSISNRLKAMAPENCQTIEEALQHATTLSDMGLCAPATLDDFSYCVTCGKPCWHGVCHVCK